MTASTTLVNVSEDAEIRFINLLMELIVPTTVNKQTFYDTCMACIHNQDAIGLVRTILRDPCHPLHGLLLVSTTTPPPAVGTTTTTPAVTTTTSPPSVGTSTTEAMNAFTIFVALVQRVVEKEPPATTVPATTTTTTKKGGIVPEPKSSDTKTFITELMNEIVSAPFVGTTTTKPSDNNDDDEMKANVTRLFNERKIVLLSVLYNMLTTTTTTTSSSTTSTTSSSTTTGSVKCQLLQHMTYLAGTYVPHLLHPESTSALSQLYALSPITASTPASSLLLATTTSATLTTATSTSSSSSSNNTTPLLLLPTIVSLLDNWNIPLQDRRTLYQTIVSVLPDSISSETTADGTTTTTTSGGVAVDAVTDESSSSRTRYPIDARKQQFLLLLIGTYSSKDSSKIDEMGMNAAKEVAIGFIKDPVSLYHQQRTLLMNPAIQTLQKMEPNLYELLHIFQEGQLKDYYQFITKYKPDLKKDCITIPSSSSGGGTTKGGSSIVVKASDCLRYMRILSLCTLASELEEIPYTTIATTLDLCPTATTPATTTTTTETTNLPQIVERWVIITVNSGLLQAKMDQVQQKVLVERCIIRQFQKQQWEQLRTKLQVWKSNIGSIVQAMQQQQQIQLQQQQAVATATAAGTTTSA